MKIFLSVALIIAAWNVSCQNATAQQIKIYSADQNKFIAVNKIVQSEKQWKKQLPATVFKVARQQGTERAFSGKYHDNHEKGMYKCYCCGTDLFSSKHKFDSGTGWPSFWMPINAANISTAGDNTLGISRTEIKCVRCDTHLGHVFDDGPKPTGLRYCINSVCLTFVKH